LEEDSIKPNGWWFWETVPPGFGRLPRSIFQQPSRLSIFYTRANIWLSWPSWFMDPSIRNANLGARPVYQELDASQVEKVMGAIWSLQSPDKKVQQHIDRERNYFQTNAERMRFAEFRRQGLFVGSGVVEAGCKTIIGFRLKQSGMQWTIRGANPIIALRCLGLSGRWEQFWENRALG